ncbi:MAG TPA: hypothetical protein G4O01_05965 [Dehalococcoidia bacterium]|jgi:TusA-related sulfurtransferase|nr:hypothetical protein [Dehalococcoidia bacterium]
MSASYECDVSDLICPLSKLRATEAINNLAAGDTVRIILGDMESVKSVVQELKGRGMKPDFKQEGESRFILTVTRE